MKPQQWFKGKISCDRREDGKSIETKRTNTLTEVVCVSGSISPLVTKCTFPFNAVMNGVWNKDGVLSEHYKPTNSYY